jgi:mRNA interferase MazF
MKRGEIWWANLPPPVGRRPVLILSRDSMPANRGEITVAYMTSTVRHLPVEVAVGRADGVPIDCVINASRGLR